MIWLRATGSTVISQLFDSFVVLYVAFILGPKVTGATDPWSWSQLLAVGVVQYTYKFGMAVLLTPVLYLVHFAIDRYLGNTLAEELKRKATDWNEK